ncbi:MAG: hypothetical protein Q9M94_01555 [Candidatus Gracilibacteria bacterium]|nr:hypothetical protein [Candidatus Gracilibacteria bacterium]MDQ7023431.1 hypothetical protein [Candidatus Gracilibacteria bacterium]
MAIISVEVEDRIAKQFTPYVIVSSYELVETIQNEEEKSDLVNFGAEGVSAIEVLAHLKTLK